MLPVNYGSHTSYQNTFVSKFLNLYPNPLVIPKQTWDSIVKFWYLDLSETDAILITHLNCMDYNYQKQIR